ncbi:MAG: M1 family aminopeptidase [Armatimonadota bacterium]
MLFGSALAATVFFAPDIRPPHQFDLLDVKLDVTLDFKAEAVSGVVSHKLLTTAKNAVLAFDKGPMTIQSVNVVGKGKFKTESTAKNVFVRCTGVPSGTPLTVSLKYSAAPEAGIYFVPAERAYPSKGSLAYTQGEMEDNRYWFPTYDFPNDKTTTELVARVPKGMSVLSNGKLVGTKTVGDQAIWHWKQDQPMSTYLISLVAGDYVAIPDGNFKGKPVQIWAPKGAEDAARTAFRGTDKLIEIYSKLTGVDYPWAKYAQSVVPEFMFGGMENLSCTTQTIGAIFPENAAATSSARGLNAHELAHQWFGDLITTPTWAHIWVNEGWATFLPHFVTRQIDGDSAYHIERFNTYEGCKASAKEHPMVRTDYTVPMEMFDGNAYPGGATRMFMLMRQLGEPKFWSATKAYLGEYGRKNVTTEQFFASYEKTSSSKLQDFRKQWFYTKGVPNFKVSKTADGFSVKQTTPGFDVDLEYVIMNGEMVTRRGVLGGTSGDPVPVVVGAGETLVLDPGAWLLCDISYPSDYKSADWERAWTLADNDAQRMRLIDKLSPVFRMAEFDRPRSDALKLELLRRTSVDSFLRTVLESSNNPKFQLTALWGLAANKGSKNEPLFERIFSTSSNEEMRNAAFDKLISVRNDAATAELGWNTNTWNLQTQTRALTWFAANDKDRARTMALKAVREFAPGPVRMRAISVLGQVKDAAGSLEVFDLLVSLAKGRAYAPMDQAINALADYGDKRAIPVIESRRNHSLHFARNTVESALARLGG